MSQRSPSSNPYCVYLAFLILAVVVSMFVAPTGISGRLIGPSDAVPQGFAPPSRQGSALVTLDPTQLDASRAKNTLTVTVRDDAIYRFFYVWINGQWERFQFSETPSDSAQAWINGHATTSLVFDTARLAPGRNFLVTYTCERAGNDWQCGCAAGSSCGHWRIQTFDVAAACAHECAADETRCLQNTRQLCGNYDADECREWPTSNAASGSTVCQNGCEAGTCRSNQPSTPTPPVIPQATGPPVITQMFPNSRRAGESVDVLILGSNLQFGKISFPPGTGITIANVQNSDKNLIATLIIAATAQAGTKKLTVTTASGSADVSFTITAPATPLPAFTVPAATGPTTTQLITTTRFCEDKTNGVRTPYANGCPANAREVIVWGPTENPAPGPYTTCTSYGWQERGCLEEFGQRFEDLRPTEAGAATIPSTPTPGHLFIKTNPQTNQKLIYCGYSDQAEALKCSGRWSGELCLPGLNPFGCIATSPGPPQRCLPQWDCSAWQPAQCSPGAVQTRTCRDINSCNNLTGKPPEQNACAPAQACTPSWNCPNWDTATCTNGIKERTCTASNCGQAQTKKEQQTCACTPNWECTAWEPASCPSSVQSRVCSDKNSCGTQVGKPQTTQACVSANNCNAITCWVSGMITPWSVLCQQSSCNGCSECATTCTPQWECDPWPASCPNSGRQSRECHATNCGTQQTRTESATCAPGCSPFWDCASTACTDGVRIRTCTERNCGGGSVTTNVACCTPEWSCNEWSACSGGEQTQACTASNCGYEMQDTKTRACAQEDASSSSSCAPQNICGDAGGGCRGDSCWKQCDGAWKEGSWQCDGDCNAC